MSLLKNINFETELRTDGNIQSLFLDNEKQQIVYINIDDLIVIENQPFRLQSDEYIKSLAEDIKENGLYSPLLIRKKENKFEILSGRHRYLAFKLLKAKEIPCILTDKDDDKALIAMINSNLNQRLNILPSELAFSFLLKKEILQKNRDKTEKGFNVWEELAKDTNFSEKKIRRLIKITNLNQTFSNLVDNNELKQQVYLEIAKLNNKEQEELCNYFIERGISFKKINKNFITNLIMEVDIDFDIIDKIFEKTFSKKKIEKDLEIENLYLKFDIEKSKWIEILDFLNKNKLITEKKI